MKYWAKVLLAAVIMGAAPMPAPAGEPFQGTAIHLVASETSPLDLNSATEEQLRTLPGVGPARAQAIIAGRPYAGKDDLVKRNILPKNVYDGVKDRIIAKQK